MKKMMILAVMMVMTISARSAMPLGSSKNAMSYNAAKHEALFLSVKMITVLLNYMPRKRTREDVPILTHPLILITLHRSGVIFCLNLFFF